MNCLQQQNNKMKESIRASIGSYRFFYVHPKNRSIISCVWSGKLYTSSSVSYLSEAWFEGPRQGKDKP